jgi:hypothetical protein
VALAAAASPSPPASDAGADDDSDDGSAHPRTSLVGFDLETGAVVEGPVALAAPLSWMGALNSAVLIN